MNKLYLTIIFTLVLVACTQRQPPSKLIAQNHDSSIMLSAESFAHWSKLRNLNGSANIKSYINGYFLEQVLLQHNQHLSTDNADKIRFQAQEFLYQKAFEHHKQLVIQVLEPDPLTINARFNELKNRPKRPPKLRLYQIFKRYPPNADPKHKRELLDWMTDLRTQINDLDGFKTAATNYSDSQSRLQKGLIGNVPPGLLAAELDELVMQLQPNQMSEVIQSSHGVMLFYCERHISASVLSDQKLMKRATQQVKNKAFNAQWQFLQNNFLTALKLNIKWPKTGEKLIDSEAQVITNQWRLNTRELGWLLGQNLRQKPWKSEFEQSHRQRIEAYAIKRAMFDATGVDIRSSWVLAGESLVTQRSAEHILRQLIAKELSEPHLKDIEDQFQNHPDSYVLPAQYTVSGLAIAINGNRILAHQKAAELLHEINHGSVDFATTANQYSAFADRYPDGLIGTIGKNRLGQVLGIDLMRALLRIDAGQYSGLVETEQGYVWILRLDDVQANRLMTFSEAQGIIRKELLANQKSQLKTAITTKLLQAQDITYYLD
ncbi:peptidylprolyl isomerase [Marinicella sediminis]|uniref:peptidylprolyl isomerase n=1 Tax=Marinicella sediminis TaxID=1792834 RepID=A0ABV7JHX0_9GAMM|nr:peptidylprolyl isomerase [Marinicella sediminis]